MVDDGSNDLTSSIALGLGCTVVKNQVNLGYDRSISIGIKKALELGATSVVTCDADGQISALDVEKVFTILEGGADLVIGVRDGMPRFVETWAAWYCRAVYGVRDPFCGLKGYNLGTLKLAPFYPGFKSIGAFLAIEAVRRGQLVEQFPIATKIRKGESRFGGIWRGNLKLAIAILCIGIFVLRN